MRTMKGIRLLTVGLLMAGLAAGTASAADPTCGRGETQVGPLETKTCPPTPRRGAVVVKRACCKNNAGRVHCQSFHQCPRRSTS